MAPAFAGRWRGCERPTTRPLVFSSWCSSFSTTRSTATSGRGGGGRAPDHSALGLLELVLQLLDHQIDRDQRQAGGSVRPNGESVSAHDDLTALAIGDPRVVLLGEVDLGPVEAGTTAAEAAHLLLGRRPDLVGHVLPAMRDYDVHLFASLVVLPGTTGTCTRSSLSMVRSSTVGVLP